MYFALRLFLFSFLWDGIIKNDRITVEKVPIAFYLVDINL